MKNKTGKMKANRDAFGRILAGSRCLCSRGGLKAWKTGSDEWKAGRLRTLKGGREKLERIYAIYKIFRSCGYPKFRSQPAFKLLKDLEPTYSAEDIEQMRGIIQRRYRQGWDIYAVLQHLLDGDL